MAKFNSRPGSEDKGRSGRSRDDRPGRRGGAKSEDDKKKKDYKAKRSFSKNKIFREIKETRDEKPRRSFDPEGRKPFKRDFDNSGSREDRPLRTPEGEERPRERENEKSGYKDRPKRDFKERDKRDSDREDRKPYKKPFERDRDKRSSREDSQVERKPKREDRDDKKTFKKPFERDRDDRPKREDPREDRKPFREDREAPERNRASREREDARPLKKAYNKEDKFSGFKKAAGGFEDKDKKSGGEKKRRMTKPRKGDGHEDTKRVKYDDFEEGKAFTRRDESKDESRSPKPTKPQNADGLIRLNKYLANAGIASRRDADNLIQSGTVKVNGVVVDQLGYKIKSGDKVTYGDAAVKSERKVYLLLNKPKDYITTVDDPKERKTVMELIAGACRERVYPVGRLDRNTTGLLLFTNDGELTTKLTHPKFGVKKVYHVSLNKGLKPEDFKAIIEGVELEDGEVKADDLAFVGEGKKEVGIEIHSGRNRIVRRLFEHLGYDVLKLDRVVFAGLTKKDLPRGKHRFLTAKEISFLQMIG